MGSIRKTLNLPSKGTNRWSNNLSLRGWKGDYSTLLAPPPSNRGLTENIILPSTWTQLQDWDCDKIYNGSRVVIENVKDVRNTCITFHCSIAAHTDEFLPGASFLGRYFNSYFHPYSGDSLDLHFSCVLGRRICVQTDQISAGKVIFIHSSFNYWD